MARWVMASWLAHLTLTVGAAATAGQVEFFERQVRPVLAARCYSCHSTQAKPAFANLRLDERASIVALASKFSQVLRGQAGVPRMPPTGVLPEVEIAAIEQWVRDGLAWPEQPAASGAAAGAGFDLQARRRAHWAWRAVQPVEAPAGGGHPVDRFLAAARAAKNLGPAAGRADAVTLLRRVKFDLTGLPPSPEEIAEAERDASPAAFARLVDRLLDSPAYGERLARRWMDVIRYAESHGSEGDPDVPLAWRYRDYLIRAFNADVPFDQLVREHIAGDLLARPRLNEAVGLNESAIGPAHWRMVEHGFQPVDPWEDRVKWTDNQIDVVTKAFQGLTVSCARCHDHKFDAISQQDFYAVFGVVGSARPTQVEIETPARLRKNYTELMALRARIQVELARLWKLAAPGVTVPADLPRPAPAVAGARFDVRADYAQWTRHGTGAPLEASRPGEFAVALAGPKAIAAVLPGGVYSHLVSTRHAAVISSPRFQIDTDYISFKTMGGQFASAQLIIENYAAPRGGIYNQRHNPKTDGLGWATWDTTFWKGFTGYFEVATYEDVTLFALDDEQNRMKPRPVAPRDGRSWFGLQQVVFHNTKERPAGEPVALAGDLGAAVDAWRDGSATEAQAALLDALVRRDLLPSRVDASPELRTLVREYRRLEREIPVARRAPGIVDEGGEGQALLVRGNHKNRGALVARRYLEALDSRPYTGDPRRMRLQLAEELASAANPLTARVMVNRAWQWLFRRGLVRTVDNFGKLGEAPSHPELLDYLARRFVDEGWSIKNLMRLLVTSEAYQMQSGVGPAADAENVYLTRQNVRRMEAEEVRDAVLTASGQLNPPMYGPAVDTFYAHDTGKTKGDKPKGPLDGKGRRSVYLEVRRNVAHPFLEAFDVPKPNTTRGQRDVTTVPAQSLALLNSDFMVEQSRRWAEEKPGGEARARIGEVWLRVMGRRARPGEVEEGLRLLDALRAEQGAKDYDADVWAGLFHTVFNLKEFLYVR
ncbi:MAG: DUF1553 domain-containing protein [Bryobacterales bacterium]|nr:DUF1553 domain-containing protein [Bryobacterales bacterium]